jgi:hypothetical protein
MEENAQFRALAERLLAHQAFHPFLDDLSRDPALADSLSKMVSLSSSSSSPSSALLKDVDPYTSSRSFLPPSSNSTHIGMAMIPEMPVDLSSLNIGPAGNWNTQPHGMPMYQSPHVFAVTELPTGPSEPIDFEALCGKGGDIVSEYEEENKATMPEIESFAPKLDAPIVQETSAPSSSLEFVFDENDPTVTLFATAPPQPTTPSTKTNAQPLTADSVPDKGLAHYEMFVPSEEDNEQLSNDLSRMLARLEMTSRRIDALLGC